MSGLIAADAAVAKVMAELAAWKRTVAADNALSIVAAVADASYATSIGQASVTFAGGIAAAISKLAGDISSAGVTYVTTVTGLATELTGATARAEAKLAVALQAADGAFMKASATAVADLTHALADASKQAATSLAAVATDRVAKVAPAVEKFAKGVAQAQYSVDMKTAAIAHTYQVACNEAAAKYQQGSLTATTNCEKILSGYTVRFGIMRTTLGVKLTGEGVNDAAAKGVADAESGREYAMARTAYDWDMKILPFQQDVAAKRVSAFSFESLVYWFVGDTATVYGNTSDMNPLFRGYVVGGFWLADLLGVRGMSDAFSVHDAADGHVQSARERAFDGIMGLMSFAGAVTPLARMGIGMANSFDEAGKCANFLTRLNHGTCFTGDTLVHVTAMAEAGIAGRGGARGIAAAATFEGVVGGEGAWAGAGGAAGAAVAEMPAVAVAAALETKAESVTVAIKELPLGSRVLSGHPRPEELDDTWPEPEQATWVTLGL